MARLIYTATTSLDGYIEDAEGRFDWANMCLLATSRIETALAF